jgi:hypothetical protein
MTRRRAGARIETRCRHLEARLARPEVDAVSSARNVEAQLRPVAQRAATCRLVRHVDRGLQIDAARIDVRTGHGLLQRRRAPSHS